jgi:hypothetical protein
MDFVFSFRFDDNNLRTIVAIRMKYFSEDEKLT